MQYIVLANLFEVLSKTSSRLKKTVLLANFLKVLSIQDARECILLLQGRVFPEWDERKVGIAGKLLLKSIARASGYSESAVEEAFTTTGDIGDVVSSFVKTKRQQTLFSASLEVDDVFTSLQRLATLEGMKSQDVKMAELSRLFTNASPLEAKFIARTVLEDLRVGIALGTFRDALALAFFSDSYDYDDATNKLSVSWKELPSSTDDLAVNSVDSIIKSRLQRALDILVDVNEVFLLLKEGDLLEQVHIKPMVPCKLMLARKEQTFTNAFARSGLPVRIEYKYDGFRLQIHKHKGEVKLFTRRLDDVTKQFPDVVDVVMNGVKSDSCIVDGEVVGVDFETRKYMPFQHISKRIKRKHDISSLVADLPVELHVFDILYIEGKEQIDLDLLTRLSVLEQIIVPDLQGITLAKGVLVSNEQEAELFYQDSLDAGNEGVMIKNVHGLYVPGGRVSAWIKMKPIMKELDLVVVEAEWGTGKRSRWMTSFTLACQDEDGLFRTIGKVGTGLKEVSEDVEAVSFAKLTELLVPLQEGKGRLVRVTPSIVLTIIYEEIQKSSTYDSGFALRFPRVIALRPDKPLDEIASIEDVYDLFISQ